MSDHALLRSPRSRLHLLLLLLIAVGGAVPLATRPASADTTAAGVIFGSVRDLHTGIGVAHARVQIGDVALTTDEQGTIPRVTLPLDGPVRLIDVAVMAPGYAAWRYSDVELSSDHPVELRVELGDTPYIVDSNDLTAAAAPFDGPPDFINIGRTFNTDCIVPPPVQRIDRMPFIDYVRNVLPNEWVASWPASSLDAGAVAVAQYAWATGIAGRKWTRQGFAFDLLDSTCDQVYTDRVAGKSYAATDAAVTRMWGTVLIRDSAPTPFITTYYRARDEQCITQDDAPILDCMGQWGSYDRANLGLTGREILHHYYDRKAVVRDINTAPQYRALVLERSPDLTITRGDVAIVSACLRNAGLQTWQQDQIALSTVDPSNSQNTAYVSPLTHGSWITPQRPALLSTSSVVLGQNSTWQFTIAAPADLPAGMYTLAVRPVRQNGEPVPTDAPIEWQILVTDPLPTLPPRVWLPSIVSGRTATARFC